MTAGIGRGPLVVAVVFLSTAVAIGSSQYAFGLFVPALEETFGWSRTQISASLSFTAAGGLAAPLLGRIMDRHGARPVLVCSLVLFGASFLLRPLMSELWHWYALSLMQFIAFSGTSMLPTGRLVGTWYPHVRGRVMGIATMGNNVGGLLVPPLVAAVLAVWSWQGGYLVLGALVLAIALLAAVVVREAPLDHTRAGGADAPKPVLEGWTVREAVRTRTFYSLGVAICLGFFTYATVLPHVTAHLINEGVSVTTASLALSALATCGMLGKLVFGLLAERWGALRTCVVNLIGQATFAVAMTAAASPVVMWTAVPLFGLFMGGFGVLFTLMVQDAFGMRFFGSIMGLLNLASVVSFGLGPLIAGTSYDLTGSYEMALLVVAGLFVVGAVVLLTTPGRPERPSESDG